MSHVYAVRFSAIRLVGVFALFLGGAAWMFALCGDSAPTAVDPKAQHAAGDTPGRAAQAEATKKSEGIIPATRANAEISEFPDPSDVARRFTTELTRLFKQNKVVSPAELFRQAQQAKKCDVAPLPDRGQKLSPEAIYARAKPAVVAVGALMRPGGRRRFVAALASGFVIRSDGVMVTNYHVIEAFQHAKAVAALTCDERVLPIQKVLAADEHNDIAVVKVDAENLAVLPIAASVPVGATVYCLSHPALDSDETETAFYTFTQGMVCGKFRLRLNGPNPLNVLAITAEYAKGSSGGPILNEHGAVVGIICQTRTLFYDLDETEPQITWKFSRPSSSLLALLKPAAGSP